MKPLSLLDFTMEVRPAGRLPEGAAVAAVRWWATDPKWKEGKAAEGVGATAACAKQTPRTDITIDIWHSFN